MLCTVSQHRLVCVRRRDRVCGDHRRKLFFGKDVPQYRATAPLDGSTCAPLRRVRNSRREHGCVATGEDVEEIDAPWADGELEREIDEGNGSRSVWTSPRAYESPLLDDEVMAFAASALEGEGVVVLEGTIEYRMETLHQP